MRTPAPQWLAALCLALGVVVAPAAPAAAAAVPARAADAFVDSIGVGVHLGVVDTPYVEEFPQVEQRLGELGVRHVRTDLFPEARGEYAAINALAAQGIRTTAIVGDPSEPADALGKMLTSLRTTLAGSVDAVEGPNEYSTRGGASWKADLIAYQERLWRGVKEDPALAALPVLGPSIVHNDQHNLGDVSAFLDYGNIHSYPEGGPPEEKVDSFLEKAELNSGSKPVFATETGYTNALNWTPAGNGENRPIDEGSAATYLPRLFFEYWNRGIVRTFDYELVDQRPDPGLSDREDHFGLLRNDLSAKPAFLALRNLIAILGDPGPGFVPGALDYSLDPGASPVHSALLEKRGGGFYLALWRPESVWDPIAKAPLTAASEPALVSLAAPVSSYAVYEPTLAAEPLALGSASATISVAVGPGVTILALGPPAESPGSESGSAAGSGIAGSALGPLTPSPGQPAPSGPPAGELPEGEPTPSCAVPRLVGRKLPAAKHAARRARCRVGRVRTRSGSAEDRGRVLSQTPAPGRKLDPEARIGVVVGR